MSKNRFLNQLLATTIICGAAAMATPAYAQDDQTEPSGPVEAAEADVSAQGEPIADEGEAIIVTGTRIPQPNLESGGPSTTNHPQDMKHLRLPA